MTHFFVPTNFNEINELSNCDEDYEDFLKRSNLLLF